MANRKEEIDIIVNKQSVDQATDSINKLGKASKDVATTTVDLSKNITIAYNSNKEPIDVIVNSSLNLKQQVRQLFAELTKLEAAGKGNTQEFRLLQRTYNDTKDALDKTNARSRELFGTLSLLPGPIGDFAGKLQGGVDLLKTFSGIKLSDFGEIGRAHV